MQQQKKVVILVGPPGSGKGTQALWFEEKLQFFHLESTAVIREQFAEHSGDPLVEKQRTQVLRGDIVDPPVILEWMRKKIVALASEGKSLVISGSPRSEFEAAGDEQAEGLIPLFERLYGKENVFVFFIGVTEEEALKRASTRRVCVAHDHPIPDLPEYRNLTACPWDGSPLRRRPDGLDDKPEIVQKRYRDYMGRMEPILAYMRKRGHVVKDINGADTIERIYEQITSALNG